MLEADSIESIEFQFSGWIKFITDAEGVAMLCETLDNIDAEFWRYWDGKEDLTPGMAGQNPFWLRFHLYSGETITHAYTDCGGYRGFIFPNRRYDETEQQDIAVYIVTDFDIFDCWDELGYDSYKRDTLELSCPYEYAAEQAARSAH